MDFVFDEETGTFNQKKEPFAIIELETEKDYKHFLQMVEFWLENHEENTCKVNIEFYEETEDE